VFLSLWAGAAEAPLTYLSQTRWLRTGHLQLPTRTGQSQGLPIRVDPPTAVYESTDFELFTATGLTGLNQHSTLGPDSITVRGYGSGVSAEKSVGNNYSNHDYTTTHFETTFTTDSPGRFVFTTPMGPYFRLTGPDGQTFNLYPGQSISGELNSTGPWTLVAEAGYGTSAPPGAPYSGEISAIQGTFTFTVPEPGTLVGLCGLAGPLCARRTRRRPTV
jgi:hypothetical protein